MSTTASPKRPSLFDDERAGSIYLTAAQLIYEKGFDGTSMNDIAEALQMTKPGLYYYVKGKKELLRDIMNFAMDLLDEEVVEPARRIADPEERLRALLRGHARLLTREEREARALAILIDEVGGLGPAERQEIIGRKRSYLDLLRHTLDELRQAGKLLPVDTTVAAFSLLGMVMWISRWYRPDGRLKSDDVVRDMTEIAAGVILQKAAPAPPAFPRPI